MMRTQLTLVLSLILLAVTWQAVLSQDGKSDAGRGIQSAVVDQPAERSPAECFSGTTLAYVEAGPPSKIVQMLLEHPLRERIESLPQVQQALKSKEYIGFLAGVGMAQVITGMEWEESLDTLAGKGLAIGFDAEQGAAGAVLMTRYPDKLPKFYRGLLKLANQNENIKVNEGEYRERKAYAVGQRLFLILLEDRVLVSDRKEMVKQMLDHWLDQPDGRLSESPAFVAAREGRGAETLWAWGNLEAIREAGMAPELFREKTENIGAELLVGGVLEVLRHSDHLAVSLDLRQDGLQVSARTSFDETTLPIHRSYFFGTPEQRAGFEQLQLDGALAEAVAFRDIGKLWLSKEELFEEKHLAELSQADSTLSTLFSGLDFGEEVLGSTLPGFQLIARNQDYSQLETPEPDIRIPEFALVFRLKPDQERLQRRLRVAYQSFIGFLNIQLAMQGQPQLELESETSGEIRIVSATYLPEQGKESEGIVHYNFSPTVAFAGQWFIVASTRNIAEDLARAGGENQVVRSPEINTRIVVLGKPLQEILKQNAEQLIAQNMLEEGNDYEAAQAQIDILLSLVGLVDRMTVKLENSEGRLRLDAGLQLDPESLK